jgi:AsmA protein
MARFLKIVLGLIVLLILVAVAVPFIVPADKIKNEVLAQIEAKTGRKVTIDHVSFTLFPVLGLSAESAVIGNPSWAPGNMAEVKSLKVGMELMPLLHGEYKLKELTLEQPVIVLIKQQGKANWQLEEKKEAQKAESAQTGETPAAAESRPRGAVPDLHLDKISITDGTVTYKDGNKVQTISGINLSIKAPDLSEKADIDLSMLYAGKKLGAALSLDKPLALASGGTAGIDLKADYGALSFNWKGTAAMAGGIPDITGRIDIPSLNTADLSQKGESGGAEPAEERPHGTASSGAAPQANASRWSDAPIKLDGLKAANASLEIALGKLTLPKTTLENIVVKLKLAGGDLQVQSNPLQAYGGTVNLSLNATSAGAINLAFAANGAEAEPLLHDFANYDRVSGTIALQAKLAMSGGSQRAFINSLSGNGSVAFKNGKLKGVNLAGLIHNVTRRITGGSQSEDDSTAFSDLSGTFTISRGIVTTRDFRMDSPLLRVTGEGDADLPNWQEHFLLKPKLVASLTGQGGGNEAGLTIPVKVDGPLDHPHYAPDLEAALKENLGDPSKLKDNVKNLKQLVPGGKINSDTLKGLLR